MENESRPHRRCADDQGADHEGDGLRVPIQGTTMRASARASSAGRAAAAQRQQLQARRQLIEGTRQLQGGADAG